MIQEFLNTNHKVGTEKLSHLMLAAGLENAVPLNTFRLSFLWSTRKFGDLGFVMSFEDLKQHL